VQDKNIASQMLDSFVCTSLFKTFRFAIQPGKMVIALLAVIVLVTTGTLMDLRPTVMTTPGATVEDVAAAPNTGIYSSRPATELHASIMGREFWQDYTSFDGGGPRIGVFSAMWEFCSARFDDTALAIVRCDVPGVDKNISMIAGAVWWAFRYHTLYTSAYFVIVLIVMAIAGGAICRSAALQFARDERAGLVECVRYSTRRFGSFFTAPLWALGVIVLLGIFIFLLGLLGNIPCGVGPVAVGILSSLAVFMGFAMTIFLVGLIAGGCLMFPAVAYEGSDGMDAMGRAFGYIYQRPWRLLLYAFLTFIYGIICYLFVRTFAFVLLLASRMCMGLGIRAWASQATAPDNSPVHLMDAIWPRPTFETIFSPCPEALSPAEKVGAILVMVPHAIVAGLVAAFLLSFFFSASTIAYALLRRHADGEGFEKIFTQADGSHISDLDDDTPLDNQ
jgi:hypothetical protein